MEAYKLLSKDYQLVESTNGWVRMTNPFDVSHNDKSLAVNFDSGLVVCHRSGYTSNLVNFLIKLYKMPYAEAKALVGDLSPKNVRKYVKKEATKIDLPPFFTWLGAINNSETHKKVINYLKGRGLDTDALALKGWGYCLKGKYAGRIIVPIKKFGYVVTYLGRAFGDSKLRYLNSSDGIGTSNIFYNIDAIYTQDKVYINEGVFDAEIFDEQGLATFNWKLSGEQRNLLIHSSVKEIIVVSDKGYYTKNLMQYSDLTQYFDIKVLNLDEAEGKDANELGFDYIKKLEDETDYITIGSWLTSYFG